MGVKTAESDMSKYRKQFEICATSCCDKSIQKLPNLLLKIKDLLDTQT